MCKTTTPQQMPLNVDTTAATSPDSPIGPIISAAGNQAPATVPVKTPTKFGRTLELATAGAYDPTGGADTTPPGPGEKPTKFGTLLNFLRPALGGAMIGGLTGKSTPGGGFAGANNFFMTQRLRQMQMGQYMMGLAKMQSDMAKNNAEAGWNNRRPMLTRGAPAVKGTDASGNQVYMAQDPNDGTWKPIQGVTPPGQTPDFATVPTDKGIVEYDRHGVANTVPLSLANQVEQRIQSGSGESASAPSNAAADGGGSGGPSPVPLMPSGFSKPKPARVVNRSGSGVETDNLIDENPNSPTFGKPLAQNVATRQAVPNRIQSDNNIRNDVSARVENYASAALDKADGDPDKAIGILNGLKIADPQAAKEFEGMLPQIRNRIRERVRPGKSGKRPRISPAEAQRLGLSPTNQSSMTGDDGSDDGDE